LGGLPKKIYQINSLSSNDRANSLLLDSGNLLFKKNSIDGGKSQEILTAETILDIYTDVGYDAVAIGPLDLAAGIDFIQKSYSHGFPWISSNITSPDGKPLFTQWITRTLGDIKVVITAVTAHPQKEYKNINIQPWQESLTKTLVTIKEKKENAFIILLSSLNNSENEQIAKRFPDINLLIGADPHRGNISPQLIGNTLLTQTAKQGKYQGLLEIIFGKQRIWGHDTARQLADLQNKLGSVNWQLRRLKKQSKKNGNENKYTDTILRLEKEKEELNREIDTSKKLLTQEKETGVKNDQYNYRFIGLKKNMPNDQPTAEKLILLNREIRELNKKNKQLENTSGNLSTLTQNMVGHSVCETCHETQAGFWKSTRHASAYSTLNKKDKSLNLDCLPCHLTINPRKLDSQISPDPGYLSYPSALRSVGCESCHGPGREHSIAPETFTLSRNPEKPLCLTCHTPEHDDTFDYALKLSRIACPSE